MPLADEVSCVQVHKLDNFNSPTKEHIEITLVLLWNIIVSSSNVRKFIMQHVETCTLHICCRGQYMEYKLLMPLVWNCSFLDLLCWWYGCLVHSGWLLRLYFPGSPAIKCISDLNRKIIKTQLFIY